MNHYASPSFWEAYDALAVEVDDGLLRFWIGSHANDDRLIQA